MLFSSCSEILSRYIYNTIRIDIESYFDLRNSTGCRCDTIESEVTKGLIILSELSLTLENMDINCGLVIVCSGEYLALLGRDGSITLDQLGCDAAQGFDGQGQRSNIQKKDISCTLITGELTALDRCTDCNCFIGVQRLRRFLAKQGLNLLLNCRNTGRTTTRRALEMSAAVSPASRSAF